MSSDVIVLGAGLAGYCAAIAAAERGAGVTLIEKTDTPGGSSLTSGGSFAFGGTDLQQREGHEDSPEKLRADLISAGRGRSDPDLIDLYVRRQLETYDWLGRLGISFQRVTLSSGQSVPRTHATNAKQMMQILHARLSSFAHARYVSGTATRRLVGGSGGRRVEGVEIAGSDDRVLASGGVVVATGGFSRSARLLQTFVPDLIDSVRMGGRGNTGDGLLMATALGADLADMGYVKATFGMSLNGYPDYELDTDEERVICLAIYRGGIIVNLEARRFVDESLTYKLVSEYCAKQTKGIALQIFDQKVMAQSVSMPTANDFNGALAKGLLKQAASLAELAAIARLDVEALQATIDRYNEFAQRGRDTDFGRTSLGNGYGKLLTIDTPPYYLFPCTSAVTSTFCGVRVNSAMQVMNVFGEAIPGLFAAGEVVGGLHGAAYMSGSALSKAAIFGRQAGESAAQDVGKR